MGRKKGVKMTEEQKAAMRAKRAANKANKKSMEKGDSVKAITDAFKHLYKTIEKHASGAGEEVIDNVKKQVASLTDLTEEKMQDARKKAIEVAEDNVRKAQEKLEELRKKYDK
jgi:regulator of sigma D